MMVVEMIAVNVGAQAMIAFELKVVEMHFKQAACVMACRNNEMINLIAKYFL